MAMYREVLAIDPEHFNARFNLTSALLENQEYTKAYDLAAGLGRNWPDDPRVVVNLAVAHIGCGRPRQAIRLLDQVADHPDAPLYEVYFHKGIAYRRLNDPDTAITWYESAARLQPNEPRLLFNMAVARDELRQYDLAVSSYRQYLIHAKNLNPEKKRQIERRIRTLQTAPARAENKELLSR